jgi:hypothetical protein
MGAQPPYMGGPSGFSIPSQPIYDPAGVPMSHGYYLYPQANRQIQFLATLDLFDLSHLTNDIILHAPFWPPILAKIPSNIPKFDEKHGKDPNNHVMTFHIWCSLNSLMDDSIHLIFFQRSLTGLTTKWYIELPCHSFGDFNTLAMEFLTHFQLPIRYETGTNILTSLRKFTSSHIFYHIHEWRSGRRLIKDTILDQLLADWFTKSIFPPIARDVTMGGVVTKEKVISRAQYLDLVYSQFYTLYNLIPHAPLPSNDPSRPASEAHVDGMIGSVMNAKNDPSPTQTFEVNSGRHISGTTYFRDDIFPGPHDI